MVLFEQTSVPFAGAVRGNTKSRTLQHAGGSTNELAVEMGRCGSAENHTPERSPAREPTAVSLLSTSN